MFGTLAKLENIIYSQIGKHSYDYIEQAKRVHNKILGNYKLTFKESKFIDGL
jgi:hypothetical protein